MTTKRITVQERAAAIATQLRTQNIKLHLTRGQQQTILKQHQGKSAK